MYFAAEMNMTPKCRQMLEELLRYICTHGPEPGIRMREVFQGIVTLLYNAVDELDLSEVPLRSPASGAVGLGHGAKILGALSEAFESAILEAARKQGKLLA